MVITKSSLGAIQVHKNVIAEVVYNTLKDVPNVLPIKASAWDNILFIFGHDNFPGIHVDDSANGEISINIKLIVRYGANMPMIGREVQETVKRAVESALNIVIKNIDVNIHGIEKGA
jgi:uncharacterized alkaline shock family protein YloU